MTCKTCNGTGKVRGEQAGKNVWIEPCPDCVVVHDKSGVINPLDRDFAAALFSDLEILYDD